MDDNLPKLVEKLDNQKLNKKYTDSKQLIDHVEAFIKRKGLILYGGFAINLLMPKKQKFYKEFTVNDLDCYSTNAKQDAIEIANDISQHNYKYVKVRKALHENTYRVFVNFLQVLDITQISKGTFEDLQKVAEYEKNNTKVYTHYKDSFVLAPVTYLKANMHFELSRPLNSYHRWEKIYDRMNILTKLFDFKSTKIEEHIPVSKTFKDILQYVKKNNLVIVGMNALKYYGVIQEYNMNLEILSTDPNATKDAIVKLLKNTTVKQKKHIFITSDSINIQIISTKDECYSYLKSNGYMIGSYDTVLYFMYNDYMQCIADNKLENAQIIYQYISTLEEHIQHELNNEPLKRLNTDCFGKYTSLKDILAKKWKKKQTLVYY
jgi:hypothetical protein